MTAEQREVSSRISLLDGFKNRRLEVHFRRETAEFSSLKVRAGFLIFAAAFAGNAFFTRETGLKTASVLLSALAVLAMIFSSPKRQHRIVSAYTSVYLILCGVFAVLHAYFTESAQPLFIGAVFISFIFFETRFNLLTVTLCTACAAYTAAVFAFADGGYLILLYTAAALFSGSGVYGITAYVRRSMFLHARREMILSARPPQKQRTEGNSGETDKLTGLLTKSAFMLKAEEALQKEPSSDELFILAADIDMFAETNKIYGAEVGDIILKGVAQRLKSAVAPNDPVCRISGEKFAVLLKADDKKAVLRIAESFRINIENSRWKTSKTSAGVTVSQGIASLCPDGTDTAEDLLNKAFEALLTAKANGRNKTVIYGDC
ncbi:MAG: GGDEF domain-containing protein [Geovibrio sp.]|nr:GGDEF domain-containing protein [Geovibrio sp.]